MAFLALGPIQWVSLLDVGLQLKLMHIPLIILTIQGFILVFTNQLEVNKGLVALKPFAVSYSVFMCLLLTSVIWADRPVVAMIFVVKFSLYFLLALGTVFYCSNLDKDRLFRSLLVGSVFASFGFLFLAWITLAQRGISLPDTVITAIRTGNPMQLQFGIFLNLFNESLESGEIVSSSVRHTAIGFIFISAIIQLAALFQRQQTIVWAALILSILIILISVSRSQIVILFLAFMLVFWAMRARVASVAYFGFLTTIFIGLIVVISSDISGLVGIIDQRFGAIGEDERSRNFSDALTLINERMFTGYGAQHVYGEKEFSAHNIFLAAWVQAGVFALCVAAVFYGILATYFLRKIKEFSDDPFHMCLIALMVLPLVRSLLSASGMFSLPEWFAIALFFSFAFRSRTETLGSSRIQTKPAVSTA